MTVIVRNVIAVVLLGLLAWGGTSLVGLREKVSAMDVEQRGAVRWLERLEGKMDHMDGKLDKLLRR